jgi:putative NADH-flavin reductase
MPEIRKGAGMNLLIFGATGKTGRKLVDQALAQGHAVTAFARDPAKIRTRHENLRVVQGDILDYDAVKSAVANQDAVVSALGVRPWVGAIFLVVILCQVLARFAALSGPPGWLVRLGIPLLLFFVTTQRRTTTLSEGTKNIVRAMEEVGVHRFICESSLGVGDSKGQLGLIYNYFLIPLFIRNIFADKEVQETVIRNSRLDWVIVRPGALTNGPHTGKYQSWLGAPAPAIRRKISRSDVADFMLRQLGHDADLCKNLGVSY